jgi:hypothetical protein
LILGRATSEREEHVGVLGAEEVSERVRRGGSPRRGVAFDLLVLFFPAPIPARVWWVWVYVAAPLLLTLLATVGCGSHEAIMAGACVAVCRPFSLSL